MTRQCAPLVGETALLRVCGGTKVAIVRASRWTSLRSAGAAGAATESVASLGGAG